LNRVRFPGLTVRRQITPFDVVIRAKNWERAQVVAYMIWAAEAVYGGASMERALGLAPMEPPIAVPRHDPEFEELPKQLGAETVAQVRGTRRQSGDTEGAIRLAARCGLKRRWQYALLKLFESYKGVSIAWRDTDPREYEPEAFRPSPYTVDHVSFAQAITSAYSAIEELGLTVQPRAVRKGDTRAKFDDGSWVSDVLIDLQRRLSGANIAPDEAYYWHRRGPARLHERGKPLAVARQAKWSSGAIRDAWVWIPDALDHARWIRNKLTGHRIDERARSLSPYEVLNVQGLARMLLLSATRSWWAGYRPNLLSSFATQQEPAGEHETVGPRRSG